jgi:hypothetical protein
MVISFIKPPIKKDEDTTSYSIYKNIHPVTPKQVVNVVDLGYLGIEKDHPEQLSALPYKKKRNQEELLQRKKRITKFIRKKE